MDEEIGKNISSKISEIRDAFHNAETLEEQKRIEIILATAYDTANGYVAMLGAIINQIKH